MAIVTKTLSMAASTGYVMQLVPLGTPRDGYAPTEVQITASQACYVKLVPFNALATNSPGIPIDPSPATGATTDFYHLLANDSKTFGLKRLSPDVDPYKYVLDTYQFIQVYCLGAAGTLKVVAY